jgi:dTDP-4-amino-4,6-dideoxygalactose transaminase
LPKEYRDKYDFNLWELGIEDRYKDKAVAIKQKPNNLDKRLKYVYCIDVEGNHNFIAKNIICHNCTATNIPLLRMGAKIIWGDINPDTLCLDVNDVKRKITSRTKAVVNVHLGGIENDLGELPVSVVSDACQAVGVFKGDFVCNSFQAIKQINCGDGGMLVCPNEQTYRKAKLMRWFGIDRERKQKENWQAYKERAMTFDIELLGYKRQMTDISATLGIEGLKKYDYVISYRKKLFELYKELLKDIDGIKIIDGKNNTYWLFTILVERRDDFARMLFENNVDSNVVQVRNDIYKIFGGKRQNLPVMNFIEDKYLSLPLHMRVTEEDVRYICDLIKRGW